MIKSIAFIVSLTLAALSLPGCSLMLSSASEQLAGSLESGILNQTDPATVASGLPSYLLLLDGLLHDKPDDAALLRAAADLNSAYAGQFVSDPERRKRLSAKALGYAQRALCVEQRRACQLRDMPFADFEALLGTLDRDDVPAYFSLGAAWAGWIQARSDDWNAVAQLARVAALMRRLVALDETYQQGNAHLYLGVMASLVPPAMGGKPELARQHFERAIALSQGRNLIAKVYFARYYARLMFQRELHDRLLREVLATDAAVEDLTLSNTLAQIQARELLASGDDYF